MFFRLGLSLFVFLCLSGLKSGSLIQQMHVDKGSLNCGVLLAAVTSKCGSVKFSEPQPCCAALRTWNNGLCWCERNALKAASNVAMDSFAFQFRMSTCNISSPFRPELFLPVASKGKIPTTCPSEVPLEERKLSSETCETISLKDRRMVILKSLSNLNVYLETDVSKWSDEIDSIFVPEATLYSVGISFSFPRVNVKKTLLSRSTIYGGALWKSSIDMDSLIWSSSDTVSYISESSYGPFSYNKIEFVSFERCSPRISLLIAQEEEATRLLRQFVYFDPSDRILWRVRRNPVSWCRKVGKICGPSFFPFDSIQSCLRAYNRLKSSQVTCSAQDSLSSTVPLHGNTLACRSLYFALAEKNPKKYCHFLGEEGRGQCRSRGCLKHWYDDIFVMKNPRFDYTVSFKCSSTNCDEQWPESDEEETADKLESHE